ncbi:hypothetical protein CBL_12283 [Carabus blaptoides fortunei]
MFSICEYMNSRSLYRSGTGAKTLDTVCAYDNRCWDVPGRQLRPGSIVSQRNGGSYIHRDSIIRLGFHRVNWSRGSKVLRSSAYNHFRYMPCILRASAEPTRFANRTMDRSSRTDLVQIITSS